MNQRVQRVRFTTTKKAFFFFAESLAKPLGYDRSKHCSIIIKKTEKSSGLLASSNFYPVPAPASIVNFHYLFKKNYLRPI